jgi:CHAD domain-containing protein
MKEIGTNDLIKQELRKTSRRARKVNKDFDKEAIHDFRVSVKSLRSFLRLIENYDPELKLKLSKKFKQLYSIAGAIREAQLELDVISGNEYPLPAYTKHLRDIINTKREKWELLFSKKLLDELKVNLTCKCDIKTPHAALEDFSMKKLTVIRKLMKIRQPATSHLHKVRKALKDIIYAASITEKSWHIPKQFINDLHLDKMKKKCWSNRRLS